jgi:hypothetical protein
MKFQQEWLTGNAESAFPFERRPDNGGPPADFILDLRLFLTGTSKIRAFLSSVTFNHELDSYTLVFSDPAEGTVLIQGEVKRLDPSHTSIVGQKQFIASGPKVCLFTPGSLWDTPEWGGEETWTQSFTADEASILPEQVNPGPKTIRRIFVEGRVPDELQWSRGGVQRIIGGNNINLSSGGGRSVTSTPDMIEISAIGGAGMGYPDRQKPVIDYVATFKGKGPDANGNVTVEGFDCLRVFQPKLGDGSPISGTIQLASDCLPCCTCSEYRNTSRAIGRRSAKVKDLCDRLSQVMRDSATAYNLGVEIINKGRKPLVLTRNIRAGASTISFSVQNTVAVPTFAYVAVRVEYSDFVLGEMTVSQPNVQIVEGGTSNVHDAVITHRETLPALPFDSSENPRAGIPPVRFPSSPAFLLCVGEQKNDPGFFPISPGGVVEVRIVFPGIEAAMVAATSPAGSVAASHPVVSFSTLAVYGASKSFGCSADMFRIKVIDNPLPSDGFDECGLPFGNDYRTIQA